MVSLPHSRTLLLRVLLHQGVLLPQVLLHLVVLPPTRSPPECRIQMMPGRPNIVGKCPNRKWRRKKMLFRQARQGRLQKQPRLLHSLLLEEIVTKRVGRSCLRNPQEMPG